MFFIFLYHILPGGDREAALLGHSPRPVLSPLWQWLVLTPPGAQQWESSWSSTFLSYRLSSIFSACPELPEFGWGSSFLCKASLPLAKSAASMGQPSSPWRQATFLPLCPSRHLDFYACWSSFQSCESISALLKAKHNQDRLFFIIIIFFLSLSKVISDLSACQGAWNRFHYVCSTVIPSSLDVYLKRKKCKFPIQLHK